MSALGTWLRRWQPLAIHGAMLAGAKPEAVVGALGSSFEVAFERWYEWASRMLVTDRLASDDMGSSRSPVRTAPAMPYP